MVWAILDNYFYTPVEVTRETASTTFYRQWNNDRTQFQERKTHSAFTWRGTEEAAHKLSAQLTSACAEKNRRIMAANEWFRKRVAELTAQGIEAGTGETEGLDAKRESPVGEADAPIPGSTPKTPEAHDDR